MYAIMVVKDTEDNKRTIQIVGAIERTSVGASVLSFATLKKASPEVETLDRTVVYLNRKIVKKDGSYVIDQLSQLISRSSEIDLQVILF